MTTTRDRFDPDDPRCMWCGRPMDNLDHLGGTIERADGGPDEVYCIDCMTPEQRREHAWALEHDDVPGHSLLGEDER